MPTHKSEDICGWKKKCVKYSNVLYRRFENIERQKMKFYNLFFSYKILKFVWYMFEFIY